MTSECHNLRRAFIEVDTSNEASASLHRAGTAACIWWRGIETDNNMAPASRTPHNRTSVWHGKSQGI